MNGNQYLNLGVVTPQLKHYGGSEIYLLECLKRWQQHAEITVYTPALNKRLLREFGIDAKVKVISLPSARTHDRRFRLLHEVALLPRIWEKQIQKHDVYFLYLFPTHLIQRRPSVWFAAEPLRMIYDLRHYSNDKATEVAVHFYPKLNYEHVRISDLEVLFQIIESVDSSAGFDRLVTNSHSMGRYLENIYGRTPDLVAYPGINLPAEITPPPTYDKVLYVGRLWRHKRVELIIKAMALTMSPNKLIIAGDGPERRKLGRLAKKLGMARNVFFLGDVSMEVRDRLFTEATCCVYTPVREPFGMVPLEAAAAGRPVVATVGGGFSEILDGRAAFLVPPYEGAIADAIHKLMSNPSRAMEMGRAARQTVEPYTWDRTADSLMALFKETVEGRIGLKYGSAKALAKEGDTRVGAHYYPWYRTGKNRLHWNENTDFAGVTDFPRGGAYSSHHKSVIRKHLGMAERSGIDFFIVNLQVNFGGLNPWEMEATHRLFDVIEQEERATNLAILLAVNTEDLEVVREAVRRVKKAFLTRPSYLRHGRKALLWYYLSDPLLGLLFYHFKVLKGLNRGIHPVATGSIAYNKFLPKLIRRFFSGWSFYSPLEVGPRKKWETVWKETYRDFVEDDGVLRAFTISPGFDDRHLTSEERKGKRRRHIPRNGLKIYERMQKAALSLKPEPHYLLITSFNEFHENTHIEPSRRFGDAYLRSTRAFSKKLRAHGS